MTPFTLTPFSSRMRRQWATLVKFGQQCGREFVLVIEFDTTVVFLISRSVFRTNLNIYDEAFLQKQLTAKNRYLF